MLNRIILMGRLAADPELRTTPNGVSVVSFRIGVARDYDREQTDWINIVAWRQTAEFVFNYFSKGSMIALEGSLQSRQYQDKSGNNRTAYKVVADHVWFAKSKSGGRTGKPDVEPDLEDYEDLGGTDRDLPF